MNDELNLDIGTFGVCVHIYVISGDIKSGFCHLLLHFHDAMNNLFLTLLPDQLASIKQQQLSSGQILIFAPGLKIK